MAEGGISYRIELDSADAEQALGRLQTAATGLFGSLEKMAAAVSGGGGLGSLATLATTATAAVVGTTTALFGMAKAAASNVDELGEMAAQMGSTIEQMSTLQMALGQFEANTATLQRAFERMGNTIQGMLGDMQKEVRESAANMQKDMNSVASASLSVVEAETKLRELQTGHETPKWLKDEIALKQQVLAVDRARIAEAEAIQKAAERQANDVRKLAQYVDALARGFGTAGIQVNATVDNIIKGLVASIGPAVTAFEGIGGSFNDLSKMSPPLRAALLKLADVFKNVEDSATKMAIATKLFGRKDAKDMVDSLSKGSAVLEEEERRLAALGFEITKADDAISNKFIASMNRLGRVIPRIATQLGLLFQPAFTELLNSMAAALENNRAEIIAWGQAVAKTVGPVIQTFARVLAGAPQAGTDDWLVLYTARLKEFWQAIMGFIFGLRLIFTGLVVMGEGVALALNTVFGTALNAFDVFIGAMVIRAAVAVVAMLAALGPVGLIIAGIALAAGALITFWPQISAAAVAAGEAITAKWNKVKAFFEAWVTTPIADAWQWIVNTWNAIVEGVTTKIEEIKALVETWVTTPVANAWQWIVDMWNAAMAKLGLGRPRAPAAAGAGGMARGGRVGGRGSGTSDSNLAWVSRGEYITPARAVRQPGVLAFLEALRRSGRLPAFAEGGLNDDGETAFSRWIKTPGGLSRNIEDRRDDPPFTVDVFKNMILSKTGPLAEAVRQIYDPIFDKVISALKSVADAIRQALAMHIRGTVNLTNELADSMGSIIRTITQMAEELQKVNGHARGGLLGGRGTGTSDSNLAWLSRGEYITPARAVRQPGVLAFLEALRRSGGNLSRVLDGMGRFALGGLVPRPALAFASGGLAGGMSNVTISFPGVPPIGGLRAPAAVVDDLRKAAAMAQVRSGGRKPSRYS